MDRARATRRLAVVAGSAAAVSAVAAAGRWSPGKPRPFLDASGAPLPKSISEKALVDVNGSKQGMFLKGKDTGNPVLLFVHGGPGMPEYFLDRTHPAGLYDDFTVCWWEQRGAGISYRRGSSPGALTVDQLVDDAIAVTGYLRDRFGQQRIYLLGHSWGSFVGVQVAARAPHLFHAYVGMAQVTYQLASELLAYDYALARFREAGDTRMVRRLEAAAVPRSGPLPKAYMKIRDEAMHRLGVGTTHDMRSVITGVFLPVWCTPDYTVREKLAFWRGKAVSRRILWDDFVTTDLTGTITELDLPVYFCSGRYDYTVNTELSRAYLRKLKAPVKGFYTFERSAHSPLFEEPAKMRQVLVEDVLAGETRLADAI